MQRLTFRLTPQDLDALDRVRGFRSRSEAIRALIREAAGTATPQSKALAELSGAAGPPALANREYGVTIENLTDGQAVSARDGLRDGLPRRRRPNRRNPGSADLQAQSAGNRLA